MYTKYDYMRHMDLPLKCHILLLLKKQHTLLQNLLYFCTLGIVCWFYLCLGAVKILNFN